MGKEKMTNYLLTRIAQHAGVDAPSYRPNAQQILIFQVLFGLKGRLSPNHGKSVQNFLIPLLHLATLNIPTTIIIVRPLGSAIIAHSRVMGPSCSMGSVVIESSVATKLSGMKKVASQVSHSSSC